MHIGVSAHYIAINGFHKVCYFLLCKRGALVVTAGGLKPFNAVVGLCDNSIKAGYHVDSKFECVCHFAFIMITYFRVSACNKGYSKIALYSYYAKSKTMINRNHPAFKKEADPFYNIIMQRLKNEVDGDHF